MNFILVYITNPTAEEAKKIALHLLKKRLIACAVISSDASSLYWWEGKIADEKECLLIGKTKEENYEKIVSEVENIHSYSIPCILNIPFVPNKKYAQWLEKELRSSG